METNPEVLKQARKVIGEYLRSIREHRGLTQAELAEAAGLRQADVSNVENGTVNYGVDYLLSYVRSVDCYFYLASKEGRKLDPDQLIRKMRDPI